MITGRKDFMQAVKIGTFHLVVRCVRRSFLQGFDEYSGKDYSHRKSWITDKIKRLLEVFAIVVAGVTVLDNHFHLVYRDCLVLFKNLTPFQLVVRWLKIHPTKEMRNEKRSYYTAKAFDWKVILEAEIERKLLKKYLTTRTHRTQR